MPDNQIDKKKVKNPVFAKTNLSALSEAEISLLEISVGKSLAKMYKQQRLANREQKLD